MPKLLICVGCSGSGKSTYAKELVSQGWGEVNRDRWRFLLFTENKKDWSLYKFSKEREKEVTMMCEGEFNGWVTLGYNIVVSDTNLNPKTLQNWINKGNDIGYDVEVKYFSETLTTLLKRDKKRGGLSVGQDVIFDQWQKWLEITGAKRYVPNEFKPKAIILDIDGTIALTNGRSHYDYTEEVLTDIARIDVIDLVHAFASTTDSQIICVSGREAVCKEWTKEWLDTYYIDYSELHMRREGDSRCDTIIKEEIFWNDIEPHYNVIAAFDDRPRVIRKWKDIGIPLVVDVCKTYKEF